MKRKFKKLFCVNGHEIAIVGRNKYGVCNGCKKPVSLGLQLPKSRKKQFCKYDHDTFICGRDEGWCNDCKKNWKNKPHIIRKQICINGHNTFICGRKQLNGSCNQCIKDKNPGTKVGRPKGSKNKNPRKRTKVCPRGHDKDVVGRSKNGSCKKCIKIVQRVDPTKDSRLKQFCPKGHDTFVVGRSKEGNCKKCQSEWTINKIKKDIMSRIKYLLRKRLSTAIKDNAKQGSAVRDLGCSIPFFKEYIQSKFKDGMTWENWGPYWELDHVIALWKFDLTDRGQLLKACHYTNLQPLTIPDHNKKTIRDMEEFYNFRKVKKGN